SAENPLIMATRNAGDKFPPASGAVCPWQPGKHGGQDPKLYHHPTAAASGASGEGTGRRGTPARSPLGQTGDHVTVPGRIGDDVARADDEPVGPARTGERVGVAVRV